MRDRDRGFLVQAQKHLRPFVAEIIDERVMQAAIARARIERDVRDIERAQSVRNDVAAKAGGIAARRYGTFDRGLG